MVEDEAVTVVASEVVAKHSQDGQEEHEHLSECG